MATARRIGMRSIILALVTATATPVLAEPVVIETVTDTSPAPSSVADRERHTTAMRRALARSLADHDAAARTHVDASITALTVEPAHKSVVVAAEVRIAISDRDGRIVSMLNAGAKVELPVRRYRANQLPRMREDAIVAATQSLCDKLKTSVAQTTPARTRIANR